MTTREFRRLTTLLFAAVGLTLASSAISSMRLELQDWDCPPAPASCERPMLVKGFPFPYISDYHGISVSGSADLVGALMGEDLFHADAFAWNVAFYFVECVLLWMAFRRRTRFSA
jgi:hypothetical protein